MGCIMDRLPFNLGAIIAPEIFVRAKQTTTSFPLSVLITALCRRAGVPFRRTTDVEITATASIDIHRIEAECTQDMEERKRRALVDTTPVIDIKELETGTTEVASTSEVPSTSVPPPAQAQSSSQT